MRSSASSTTKKETVSTLLEVAGLAAVAVGLGLVAVWLGLVAGGAELVVAGIALSRSTPPATLRPVEPPPAADW